MDKLFGVFVGVLLARPRIFESFGHNIICIFLLYFQIVFEYLPNALGVMESFWRFVIPEHNISIPFLLAGNANDPTVSLDRSHFNYKALLIGKNCMLQKNLILFYLPAHQASRPIAAQLSKNLYVSW